MRRLAALGMVLALVSACDEDDGTVAMDTIDPTSTADVGDDVSSIDTAMTAVDTDESDAPTTSDAATDALEDGTSDGSTDAPDVPPQDVSSDASGDATSGDATTQDASDALMDATMTSDATADMADVAPDPCADECALFWSCTQSDDGSGKLCPGFDASAEQEFLTQCYMNSQCSLLPLLLGSGSHSECSGGLDILKGSDQGLAAACDGM